MIICGSGKDGELTFIDMISLISFAVGLENLELNVTADDIAAQTADLDARVNEKFHDLLTEIHTHLRTQDDKLEELLRRTEK